MATGKKFPPKKSDTSHLVKPAVKRNWSTYQKAIFKDIASGLGHTIIIARAGSAKTSSLVEGSRYIPKGKKSLFCAFNKSIQEELKSKLGSYIECSTLHSLGYRAIRLKFGNVELDNNKTWDIVSNFFSHAKDNYDLIDNICKTVDFCKANLSDTPAGIEEMIFEYDIELCETELKDFIAYVLKALRQCKEKTNVIDFNDMIWFPFVYRLNPGKYDYVFIDEAQDLNKAQIELALSAVKPITGRVVAVLDNYQALYSWRGADSRVLDNLRERLKPKELSLPICYRCPKLVVIEAQKFVPDILPFEESPDGSITDMPVYDLMKMAKAGSYVVSRLNAPLIKHCLRFLKNGIPANILGRDIGNNLMFLIKKSKKKTIKDFLKWLESWEKDEKERLLSKYPKANTESITDKVECMENLCDGASTLDEVKKNIEKLFQDNDESKIVLFSSVHRIKGKETDKVFVLADTLRSATQEELNIHYVAITRCKKELFMVWNRVPNAEIEEEKNRILFGK